MFGGVKEIKILLRTRIIGTTHYYSAVIGLWRNLHAVTTKTKNATKISKIYIVNRLNDTFSSP